eukprot:3717131-Rhodomonas_salina.6
MRERRAWHGCGDATSVWEKQREDFSCAVAVARCGFARGVSIGGKRLALEARARKESSMQHEQGKGSARETEIGRRREQKSERVREKSTRKPHMQAYLGGFLRLPS